MTKTFLVSVKGGTHEFTPEPDEKLRYMVYGQGELVIERMSMHSPQTGIWDTVRVFAAGYWQELEVVD